MSSEPNLVARIGAPERGGKVAADALFGARHSDLRRFANYELARQGVCVSPTATTSLHKAYIQMAGVDGTSFPDPNRFMGYAGRVMRGLIVDHARSHQTQKRGDKFRIRSLQTETDNRVDGTELIRIGEALDELAQLEPALAKIVDLRFFRGFTCTEIAALRGLPERTVQRQWEKARAYLRCRIRVDLDL